MKTFKKLLSQIVQVQTIESRIESLETALSIIEGFLIEERNGRIENE